MAYREISTGIGVFLTSLVRWCYSDLYATRIGNCSRFLSACGGLSFALSGLEIKEVMNLFPGAYAPGYALFRPFGPNKEKAP